MFKLVMKPFLLLSGLVLIVWVVSCQSGLHLCASTCVGYTLSFDLSSSFPFLCVFAVL